MNQSYLNPFATLAIPESVHRVLEEHADAPCLCARFNPRGLFAGQYIAAARRDTYVVIYDVETGETVRDFSGHVGPVTHLSWSYTARYMVTASADWNVIVWDLKPDPPVTLRTMRFDAPVAQVAFAPGCSKLLLVTLETQQVILVDLRRRRRRRRRRRGLSHHASPNGLEQNGAENGQQSSKSSNLYGFSADGWHTHEVRIDLGAVYEEEQRRHLGGKSHEGGEGGVESQAPDSLPPITTAQFHPTGAFIFAGTTRGEVLVFSVLDGGRLICRTPVGGASAIRQLALDRSGKSIVVNSNDRSIRILTFDTVAPLGSAPGQPRTNGATSSGQHEHPVEEVCLQVQHRFQDLINRTPWLGIGFSGDGEYVFAGAAHKAAHNVYVWDRPNGALCKVLNGPREPLVDADWHPTRPILLSVSVSGPINVWFTPNAENWSAYAPGFVELEENIEYQEGEDEFDLEDEDEVTRRKHDEEEADVDALTVPALPGDSGAKPLKELTDPKGLGLDPRPRSGASKGLPVNGGGALNGETAAGNGHSGHSADDDGDEYEYAWDDDPETLCEEFALCMVLENDEDADDVRGVEGVSNGHGA